MDWRKEQQKMQWQKEQVQRHRGIKYVVNFGYEHWTQVSLSFFAYTFTKYFIG